MLFLDISPQPAVKPLYTEVTLVDHEGTDIVMKKPWSGEKVRYPDADPDEYASQNFSFTKL
jgi:lysine 2,3-aminomutase